MYPKILIFGQPFNNFSGGGITLTNLFRGWPKDKIAVTFIGHGLLNVTTDVCDTYYQLGNEEHRWIFPLNLIQRKFNSGVKTFNGKLQELPVNSIQKGLRYKIVNGIFYPFLHRIGLFHAISKISLSERMKTWLSEFKPDILYLQVSSRETILFATALCDFLKIPAVIHFMDDWPTTISSTGLFKNYWSKKIDGELKSLLEKTDLHLSISDAMSEEYGKRYKKKFIPFHNPIDVDVWAPFTKKDFSINRKYVKMLYSGRIGENGISESVVEVASAIDSMKGGELNIKLHIQTPTKDERILNRLKKHECVVINPFAEYKEIPKIFSGADILLMANDFSTMGMRYLRFSMPTKASEYMISGSPVLVYSSDQTAVSQFFRQNNCGYCVTKPDLKELKAAIQFLIENEEYRKMVSRNAVNLARERFDSNKVREKFQRLLINASKSQNYVQK
jgi:glycosyltransferase involved in cell wall biosynthesis